MAIYPHCPLCPHLKQVSHEQKAGVAAHQWPPQHGPPSPLPTFIKFADLKAAGIVNNHCALRILIDNHNFPKGRWLGSATHVWTLNEVEQWLANRPVERPVPNAPDKGRR